MKVSSQVLSIAVLAGCVAANERGRQNDWHKVTKPNKFKPNAPRNEGKVLREDRESSRAPNNSDSNTVPATGDYIVVNSTLPGDNLVEQPGSATGGGSVNQNSARKVESLMYIIFGLFVL